MQCAGRFVVVALVIAPRLVASHENCTLALPKHTRLPSYTECVPPSLLHSSGGLAVLFVSFPLFFHGGFLLEITTIVFE